MLIYGDSNVEGQRYWISQSDNTKHESSHKWTNILSQQLQSKYELHVDGLGGRTAGNINTAKHKEHNGFSKFVPLYELLKPLDCVIIMLGTNDLKPELNQSAEQIVSNLKFYRDQVANSKIYFIEPPYSRPNYSGLSEESQSSLRKALEESKLENIITGKLDLSHDGLHLSRLGNQQLADIVFDFLNFKEEK